MTEQKQFDEEDRQELEYLKSQEFTDNFRKVVEEETWGKGLPKIYGSNNTIEGRYEIIAEWKDGKKELLGYNKDGMSVSLPSNLHNTTGYKGYWKESFTQEFNADSLQELLDTLNEKKELAMCNHKQYIGSLKYKQDEERDALLCK